MNIKRYFPLHQLNNLDYCVGGCFLVACFFSFCHRDIFDVGRDSLNYLFGNPLDFYENCKRSRLNLQNYETGIITYPPTTYAIFAIWLYPLKLSGLLTSPLHFSVHLVYWLKTLTTIVYIISGILFYRITEFYSVDKNWCKYVTALWLTTPLAIFSQFIFSQYDIFYVFLTLCGFLMFLRKSLLTASICFGIAITFKYFPIFVFIPLLLLFEKKFFRIFFYLFVFIIPTLLIQYLYFKSPAFIENVNNNAIFDRVFISSIDVGGGWKISCLLTFFTILCGVSYLSDVSEKQSVYTASYIFLVASALPFLFILWHPQWLIFLAPAITLTSAIDGRCEKFLTLDLIGMFFFVATISLAFQNNVDANLFRLIPFDHSYKMSSLFSLFKENSLNVFLSAFWGYLIIHIVAKFRLFGILNKDVNFSENCIVNYQNIRYRFYFGIFIFLIPALVAVYLSLSQKANTSVASKSLYHGYGQLLSKRVFEQSFIASSDYLEEIELLLSTYSRKISGIIVLELINSKNQVLFRTKEPTKFMKNIAWQKFEIPVINVKKGATYKIRLTSPTGRDLNSITWISFPNDSYLKGNAIVDGSPQNADFGFKLKFVNSQN
jgi:hypothetical protein